jgi:hypothetical protein
MIFTSPVTAVDPLTQQMPALVPSRWLNASSIASDETGILARWISQAAPLAPSGDARIPLAGTVPYRHD